MTKSPVTSDNGHDKEEKNIEAREKLLSARIKKLEAMEKDAGIKKKQNWPI